jgi:chromatin segregation and condensation protein Rec8/ScpA/Scc1 (kleisin family)
VWTFAATCPAKFAAKLSEMGVPVRRVFETNYQKKKVNLKAKINEPPNDAQVRDRSEAWAQALRAKNVRRNG